MIKMKIVKKIYYGIILFIMLKPESIQYISEFVDVQWSRLRYFTFLLVFLSAFLKVKKIKRHTSFLPTLLLLLLYGLSLFLGSITTSGSYANSALYEGVRLLSMFFLCFILYERGTRELSDIFIIVYFIYGIINLMSILIWPEGMFSNEWGYRSNYFLGAKNVFILYFLPWFTFIVFQEQCGGRKPFHYICYAIGIISSILVWSASNLFILSMVLIWVLFRKFFVKHKKVLNLQNYIILTIIIFVIMVIAQDISMFAWLIEGILRKDVSLTSRTGIWNSIIVSIVKKPLFGYGILSGDNIIAITQNKLGINAHNMYLWALFRGGILNLGSLIILLLYSTKKLRKNNNVYMTSGLSWCLFSLLIAWMVEIHSLIFMFPIIYLAIFASDSQKNINENFQIRFILKNHFNQIRTIMHNEDQYSKEGNL